MSKITSATQAALSELRQFSLFKAYSAEAIQEICGQGEVRVHKHREIVFHAGESANYFGIILSGAYKLSRYSLAGDESVIHFCAPGDVVAALIMSKPNSSYPVTIKAMGPSRMLVLPREEYIEKWLNRPDLVMGIQNLLSHRMAGLQSQKASARLPMQMKIASLLLHLTANDKRNEITSNAIEIQIPLTRKEIADTLGVAVESVIRVMSEWEKSGHISTMDQQIRILNVGHLIQVSEAQPH